MYKKYFKTIGLALIIPIVFLYAFQQGASLAYNYWLSMWADDPIVNGTQTDTDRSEVDCFWSTGLCTRLATAFVKMHVV